ncbi:unnamed protein product [Heligmosomoides polygyrus]|uniref:glucuronosyltransferase n=1 Tax=Heligmosomoides polygyrus TaxID=6339 RepID=A0A183FTV5_HELPZ|nr:unnamed protein product [Heligmosomoides polygyrus]
MQHPNSGPNLRDTLLEVFESMPNTTFIWKYEEKGSSLAAHLKNVHLSTWVPQNALLGDPRLTTFITHGGLGSVTELAHMGKPAILVPMFGDQSRNAHMLSKHGGGIVLNKDDLEKPQRLRDALNSIFSDARFGRLPNLDPYGRHLSYIEYFLIDIVLVAVLIVAVVGFVAVKVFRKCFSVTVKSKKD